MKWQKLVLYSVFPVSQPTPHRVSSYEALMRQGTLWNIHLPKGWLAPLGNPSVLVPICSFVQWHGHILCTFSEQSRLSHQFGIKSQILLLLILYISIWEKLRRKVWVPGPQNKCQTPKWLGGNLVLTERSFHCPL